MRYRPYGWMETFIQEHKVETMCTIGTHIFYEFDGTHGIWSLDTSQTLFDSFGVGQCTSAQIDLTIVPTEEEASDIDQMAQIGVYVRLVSKDRTSPWVAKGKFFIDTREWDSTHSFLSIHGYDAMLKTEQPYVVSGGWTKRVTQAVEDIAREIGVEVDDRMFDDIVPFTPIDYILDLEPIAQTKEYTIRKILGYIGALYAANWVISDDGKLRMVRLWNKDEHYSLGSNAFDVKTYQPYEPIGILKIGNGENVWTIGTVGRTLFAETIFQDGFHGIDLYQYIVGYQHQPFQANAVFNVDPMIEIGDNLTLYGTDFTLSSANWHFCSDFTADFAAFGGVENEYIVESQTEVSE